MLFPNLYYGLDNLECKFTLRVLQSGIEIYIMEYIIWNIFCILIAFQICHRDCTIHNIYALWIVQFEM